MQYLFIVAQILFLYLPPAVHLPNAPSRCTSTDQSCAATSTCPAPMYFKDGAYLGTYSNQPSAVTKSTGQDNFGLDDYEPLFFHPLPEWSESEFHVQLNFDDTSYEKDIFYFCHVRTCDFFFLACCSHYYDLCVRGPDVFFFSFMDCKKIEKIHNMMSGRIKLLQNGQPISVDDVPEIPYDYDVPGTFDETCGTHGLDDWQLPHPECPAEFVCDVPAEGPKKDFADCIDAMNCHMMAGMTTKMTSQSEIALFIHQMIPHHQNAVNMAKTLLHSGALDGCTDVTNDEDPLCVMKVIMYHIINGQNHEIQSMRGVLESLELPASDDCTVELGQQKEDTTQSRALQGVAAGATGVLLGAAAHLM